MAQARNVAIVDATLLEAAGADVGDAGATVGSDLQIPVVPDDEARAAESFLCSSCRKTLPLAEINVLPAFSDRFGRWVSAYRCRDDVAGTLAAARTRIAHTHLPDEDAYIGFVGSFLELVRAYVRDQDLVRERVRGVEALTGLGAILDMLEAGAIRFELGGPSPDPFDDGTPEQVEELLQQVTWDLLEKQGFVSPILVVFQSKQRPDEILVRRYVREDDDLVETKGKATAGPVPPAGTYLFEDAEGGSATLTVSPDGHAHVRFSK